MKSELFRVRVWDLPIRVFHWLFAISFVIAFLSRGDARYLDSHIFAGYIFTGLLIFRIFWGMVGSDHARFKSFRFSPRMALRYLFSFSDNREAPFLGHNPIGSIAIYLMLLLAILISISGFSVYGGVEQRGVLHPFVTMAMATKVRDAHEFFAWTMLGIVFVHLLGVLVQSRIHRQNLTKAMLNGYKVSGKGIASVPNYGWIAAIIVLVVTSFTMVTFKGYVQASEENPYLPFQPVSMPQSEQWNVECGECHVPYHPSLLPQRSWITLLKQQRDHFGRDLDLQELVVTDLRDFALRYSSERHLTEAAWFIDTTTPLSEIDIRITETNYWKKQHQWIDAAYWVHESVQSKSNCDSCHYDARQGSFEDGAMHLPKIKKPKKSSHIALNVLHNKNVVKHEGE